MQNMKHDMLGCIAPWFARIGFGLVLVGFGVNHYRFLDSFRQMAIDGVGPLGPVAGILAYVFPALLIVGGALFAVKQLKHVAKFCILAALGGIIGWGGVGLMLVSGEPEVMQATMQNLSTAIFNTSILLILYSVVRKMGCCHCSPSGGCGCGSAGCNCAPVK